MADETPPVDGAPRPLGVSADWRSEDLVEVDGADQPGAATTLDASALDAALDWLLAHAPVEPGRRVIVIGATGATVERLASRGAQVLAVVADAHHAEALQVSGDVDEPSALSAEAPVEVVVGGMSAIPARGPKASAALVVVIDPHRHAAHAPEPEALVELVEPGDQLALLGGDPTHHLALDARLTTIAASAAKGAVWTLWRSDDGHRGGDRTPTGELGEALSSAWRQQESARQHLRAHLEQAEVEDADHRWLVEEAQRRVTEARAEATEARRRLQRAERRATRARERLVAQRGELRDARDRVQRQLEREQQRREQAEARVRAMRERRWWRLGQVLGAARRRPRLLVRLPVDVARVLRGR